MPNDTSVCDWLVSQVDLLINDLGDEAGRDRLQLLELRQAIFAERRAVSDRTALNLALLVANLAGKRIGDE
jgi:hypothetical protein